MKRYKCSIFRCIFKSKEENSISRLKKESGCCFVNHPILKTNIDVQETKCQLSWADYDWDETVLYMYSLVLALGRNTSFLQKYLIIYPFLNNLHDVFLCSEIWCFYSSLLVLHVPSPTNKIIIFTCYIVFRFSNIANILIYYMCSRFILFLTTPSLLLDKF